MPKTRLHAFWVSKLSMTAPKSMQAKNEGQYPTKEAMDMAVAEIRESAPYSSMGA